MIVEKIVEELENRERLTQNLIKKLNEVWQPIIKDLEHKNLTYAWENGFAISTYISSDNYGDWYDIQINNRYLPKEEQEPLSSGFWCGNFNYSFEAMSRSEIIDLAKETKKMLGELLIYQQNKSKEIEDILSKFPQD